MKNRILTPKNVIFSVFSLYQNFIFSLHNPSYNQKNQKFYLFLENLAIRLADTVDSLHLSFFSMDIEQKSARFDFSIF